MTVPLTNVAIFEMPKIQLPAFHFKIGVLLPFKVLILCRFTVETDEILLQFFDLLLPSVPFYSHWKAQKIFSVLRKRIYWEEISEWGYQKENREFPIWFPSKKLR